MRSGVLRAAVLSVAALAVAGASALFLVETGSPASPGRAQLVAAKRGTVAATVSAAGSAVAADTRELAFAATGAVRKVYVAPGDEVEAGDPLARIDDTLARENHSAAAAALAAAEDSLTKARATPTATPAPDPGPAAVAGPSGRSTCPTPRPRASGTKPRAAAAPGTAARIAPVAQPLRGAEARTATRITPVAYRHPTATPGPSASVEPPHPTGEPGPQRTPAYPLSPAPEPPVSTPTARKTPPPSATPAPVTPTPATCATPTPTRTAAAPRNERQARQGPTTQRQTGRTSAKQTKSVPQAEADLAKAEKAYQDAEAALKGVTIKAPAPGTVLSVAGGVGSQAGTGTFVTLGDLDELQVEAMFSQTDVSRLKIGQPAEVGLATRQGADYRGTVTRIAPTATTDGDLVRYAVLIALDKPPAGLLIGQSAIVEVTTEKSDDTVYLPARAVRTGADGSATVTLREDGGDTERAVGTGVRGDLFIEITDGLTEGTQVLLPGSTTPDLTFPGL
ncbi:HlyD family efflux transporter periplasmic adaptor subunit [Streptosporangium sp. KLBMP 9127]|nr:HlyD family efflux transporter periplasmic adaptor subunit [Streptosporangium sp. KLBMP 9127]